jgi:hypothetical protein
VCVRSSPIQLPAHAFKSGASPPCMCRKGECLRLYVSTGRPFDLGGHACPPESPHSLCTSSGSVVGSDFCTRPCRTITLDLGEACRVLLLVAELGAGLRTGAECRRRALETRAGGERRTRCSADARACIRVVAQPCALAGRYYERLSYDCGINCTDCTLSFKSHSFSSTNFLESPRWLSL